jgi:hypothetical protein
MMIKRIFKRKDKEINMQEVATLNNNQALTIDNNKDGIPDYIQRKELPSIVKTISDTTLAHVDAQKEIESIIMDWRGYEYNPDKSKYVPTSPPMVNEIGIRQLPQIFKIAINKLTMNSNISEDWCHMQTLKISQTVVEWLADNQKLWGIKDSDLTPISEQIDAFVFLVLSRGINDRQREHDTRRMQLTGDVNRPQQTAI